MGGGEVARSPRRCRQQALPICKQADKKAARVHDRFGSTDFRYEGPATHTPGDRRQRVAPRLRPSRPFGVLALVLEFGHHIRRQRGMPATAAFRPTSLGFACNAQPTSSSVSVKNVIRSSSAISLGHPLSRASSASGRTRTGMSHAIGGRQRRTRPGSLPASGSTYGNPARFVDRGLLCCAVVRSGREVPGRSHRR